jgi:radical SAM superfamily enzyme YgiQ (UPF0313 family)
LRKTGILVHGMFVVGAQCDTKQSIRHSLKYAIRQKLSTVQFLTLTPLPGTQDQERLELTGRIFDHNWSHYDAHHTVHEPENMSAYTLQREALRAMKRFYAPWRILTPYVDNVAHWRQAFCTMCMRAYGWLQIRLGIRDLRAYTRLLPRRVKPI